MKVLFICRANVGRSQAAMELYRQRGGDCDSAGTEVDAPGTQLTERPGADIIAGVVKEDYRVEDMIHNYRTQLTEEQAKPYDKLVVMSGEFTPDWLRHDPRAVFWDIEDTKGLPAEQVRPIVAQIKSKIDSELTS